MTSFLKNIFEAQKICREHRNHYRWSIVGLFSNMTLTVLFPKGYTSRTHYQIIDKMNIKGGYNASIYFKVVNLERSEGGFNLIFKDYNDIKTYKRRLREFGEDELSKDPWTIRCNLLDRVDSSNLDSVLRTSYGDRDDTNIVTYKADPHCRLIFMMKLHKIISDNDEGIIVNTRGYPADNDDIWSSQSIWY